MHSHPMIYYWARYEAFRKGATFLLPHCNNKYLQRLNDGCSEIFHNFREQVP
jgi:hypothetical protein